MKKIIVFIALAVIALSLVACDDVITDSSTIQCVSAMGPYDFLREEVTDVMYLRCTSVSGLTVMLDPETGLPLTYARYIEIYETKDAE